MPLAFLVKVGFLIKFVPLLGVSKAASAFLGATLVTFFAAAFLAATGFFTGVATKVAAAFLLIRELKKF